MKQKIVYLFIFYNLFSLQLYTQPLVNELPELVQHLTILTDTMVPVWLILGAGTEQDYPLWNEYAKKNNINWYAVNIDVAPNCAKCFKIDFNKWKVLEDKLPNNFYDVILFDQSTIDMANWNEKFVEVLAKKLKPKGKLLIEVDPQKLARGIVNVPEFKNYDEYKKWYLNQLDKALLGEAETKWLTPLGYKLLIGQNFKTFTFPHHTNKDYKEFFAQIVKDIIIPFNKKLFGKYYDVEIKYDDQYPGIRKKEKFQYYSLTKK